MGKINLTIYDYRDANIFPYSEKARILLNYNCKRLVCDLQDGYWDGMEYYLKEYDYYFKRSFSEKNNERFSSNERKKIYPLGFNYFVTCKGNPYGYEKLPKLVGKSIIGRSPLSFFTADLFTHEPVNRIDSKIRIIYYARLYDPYWNDNDMRKNEINYINSMRIELIRGLREKYGNCFLGGLEKDGISKQLAPELIVPKGVTEKGRYLKLLHTCDIGIGSMGLHESIGWKTAEYIAASMGIVNEKFHYSVPGKFEVEKNYLDFTTAKECIEKVKQLIDNPEQLQQMKINNRLYYEKYLAPDKLVWNALQLCEI